MTTSVETNPLMMNSNATAYTINQSLRFRSSASAYLNRTAGAPTDANKWTLSFWIKRGALGAIQIPVGKVINVTANFDIQFTNNVTNSLMWQFSNTLVIETNQVFQDTSSWYHLVFVWDVNNATPANRAQIYCNGSLITSYYTDNRSSITSAQNAWNTTGSATIGAGSGASNAFDGYIAEFYNIDGQALTPSSFGAYDSSTGVWQPKKYTGTYGTNGFYLPFSNNSSVSNLGLDFSGNGNNWTPNNFSLTAGSTYDYMLDSPTPTTSGTQVAGNYAVLNPLNSSTNVSPVNGNLSWTWGGASHQGVLGSMSPTSGAYYFEAYVNSTTTSSSAVALGVAISSYALTSNPANGSGTWNIYASNFSTININGTATGSGAVFPAGTVLQCAYDANNNKLWLGKNNTWYDSAFGTTGNPSTGANPTASSLPSGLFPYVEAYSNGLSVNFGQQPFTYTPPTGFKSLCTSNLPTPAIVNGATAMAATLYTGTGAVANINNGINTTIGTTFKPDLVWIKSRSNATNQNWFDSIRGATNYFSSNLTNAQATNANTLTSFASNGFGLGTDSGSVGTNISGNTYVGWNWIAGGTAVSNTSGTITSQVSANPTVGFSVVSYTGNGTSGSTVGHGLNTTPSMIIVKSKSATGSWPVYTQSVGSSATLLLDTINASGNYSGAGYPRNPNSNTFELYFTSTGSNINANGVVYSAYCWTAIPGYSAFGSYTGNGSADGPFVYLGFRPRWIMWKRSDASVGGWTVEDTSRGTYNVMGPEISAESAIAEATVTRCDFLSNGFKLRAANGGDNASGGTYIYAAFAENPFKYALAR